jgi:hypothetical protein
MGRIIHELLRRPIAYQPIIAKAFGSVQLAILWSQLYYWSDKGSDPDGWIYKTSDELYSETGLKRRGQDSARKLGRELGIIKEKKMGMPAKIYFMVDIERTAQVIEEHTHKQDSAEETVEDNLPEWLDREAWGNWEKHRREIRKKLTPSTKKSQLKMLERNKANHVQIIENSIQNGWTGLFEIKGNAKQTNKLESSPGKYANVGQKV